MTIIQCSNQLIATLNDRHFQICKMLIRIFTFVGRNKRRTDQKQRRRENREDKEDEKG